MSHLKDFIGKPLLIKAVGQDGLFACTLENIDEHGIWVTGPELLRSLGGLQEQFQLAFLSFSSIQYLAAPGAHLRHKASEA